MTLAPDQIVRDYQIIEPIGAGGFGIVYKAHQASVKRDVALKMILPTRAAQPEFTERFVHEAQMIAALEHPHIVPLYDFWQDSSGAYLIMRYMQGGSLSDILAQQGTLALTDAVRIIRQVGDALAASHEARVVHRDIKPGNILIDQRGNAYLGDFGLADLIATTDDTSEHISGTMKYLAPEVLVGESPSPQSDIYALGLVLFKMLTGRHAFEATAPGQLVMAHLRDPVPDVTLERPDIPPYVNIAIQRATSKVPEQRYPNAKAFVHALEADTQPVRLTPANPNRDAMLQHVREFWVEGVLENSLHQALLIDLGLQHQLDRVHNPWSTFLRTHGGDETLPPGVYIVDVFDEQNGKLLILGDPGSGKTTMLLQLTRALLDRAELDPTHPIPVVFNLSSWGERRLPLAQWLVEELSTKYQVPRKTAAEWIRTDALLLLLDALDEVAEGARDECVAAINAYRAEHGFVDIVVCTRITDYEAITQRLMLNGAVVVQPLGDEQIRGYLNHLGPDVAGVRELIFRDEQLRELAASPLMLSIMVLAYRGKHIAQLPDYADLETQRQHLFDVYVERVFSRHTGGQPYTQRQVRDYLRWLARSMQAQAKSVFNIEEMQPALLNAEGHQQYVRRVRLGMAAASGLNYLVIGLLLGITTPLSLGVLSIGLGVLGFIGGWQRAAERSTGVAPWHVHAAVGGLAGLVFLLSIPASTDLLLRLMVAVGYGLGLSLLSYITSVQSVQVGNDLFRITPMERLQFSEKALKPVLLPMGFALAVLIIPVSALLFNPTPPSPLIIAVSTTLSGLVYAAWAILFGAFVSEDVTQRVTPNEGINQSMRTSIKMASISAPFVTLAWLLAIPAISTAVGGALALAMTIFHFRVGWERFGGRVVLQHMVLRNLLHHQGAIPRDLVGFLDYAASLILLRKVGGGYIFVHRYLLEYFTRGADEAPHP